MKYANFLYMFMFDKSFRFWLMHTLFYAMKVHDSAYGDGASDVIVFEKYSKHIFDENYLETFYKEKSSYRIPINAIKEQLTKLSIEELNELTK